MVQRIQGEAPFQVNASNFSIGPSNEGYTLQISADGVNYSNLFTVGVGVTRMVTGVANGSFYRLLGNGSEVAINWRQQCNDGGSGGSGSQGPEGPQGPQGATGPQGPAGQDGIDQNPTVLASISALPESAETGDIVALSDGVYQYDGTDWNEVGGGSGVLVVNSLSSSEAANAPEGSLVVVYQPADVYLGYWANTNGANANNTFYFADGFWKDDVLLVMCGLYDNKVSAVTQTVEGVHQVYFYESDVYGTSNTLTVESGSTGSAYFATGGTGGTRKLTVNFTGGTLKMVWAQNTGWDYYYKENVGEHNLYMKVSGGTVAHWQGYRDANQTDPFEIIYDDLYDFTNFCDGKVLFTLKYQYGSNNFYAYMDAANQAIILYSDSAKTSEIARANYLSPGVKFYDTQYQNSRYAYVEWKEDGVYIFNKQGNTTIDNLIDFHTEGAHFTRITDPTKATASDLGLGNTTANGVPIWNNEGVIVGKSGDAQKKLININSTGSSNSVYFWTSVSSWNAQRMFVPTQSGIQGQILTSAGNSEPQWADWIKVVKITSAAYEALVTKDPSTLYVIDDNA